MRAIFAYICVVGFYCNFAYGAFCFRLLLTQLRESIWPAHLHNRSTEAQLAVCLSLGLSLDQYVPSVLHVKCHPHTKQVSLSTSLSRSLLLSLFVYYFVYLCEICVTQMLRLGQEPAQTKANCERQAPRCLSVSTLHA